MKHILLTFMLSIATVGASAQKLPAYLDTNRSVEERIDDAISRMTIQEKIRVIHAQSKFSSAGVPRLGFPDFWTDDGPHGVRPDVLWDEWEQAGQSNDSCVAFPALTCLAASWNPQLSRLYGHSLGEEALYRGKDMILGPGVNIYRTPLGGRNFEYMGEDPFLTSTMVVPYIQGMQALGISACVKHYCVNNDEENRFNVNVRVSDRALHEIYLPAFKAAVEKGKVWAIMGSYNLYRDEHCCHNSVTLNKILKGDWQFDGVVVSDWGGAHDTDQAVKNGLDMEFGSWTNGLSEGTSNAYDNYYLAVPFLKGINEGRYTTKQLDEKVRRVLRLFYRTTMRKDRPFGFLCSDDHYAAACKISEEGIVLLQNKGGVLPLNLKKGGKVLVVGENAIKMMTVGGGSSSLKVQKEISPLDGLKARLAKDGVTVDYARGYVGDVTGNYNGVTTGQNLDDKRSQEELVAEAVEKARHADCVVMFGGLNKSDYQDCEGHDRKDYALPYGQDKLIEALAKANAKMVYVNISGNAVAMPWRNSVPAIVQGWYLGSEAGDALASVLVGDANPSGKLPFTWVKSLKQVGAHALNTYPGVWRKEGGQQMPGNIIDEDYKEGIYVGYRWTDLKKERPEFAFGHGLSYTTFALSNLRADKTAMGRNDSIAFTVNVKNTGAKAGAETVQLYIHDRKASVDRPVKELKGFSKVWLEPGESKDVTIVIDNSALSFYDEAQAQWRSENGIFEAWVGNASDNLKLKKAFELK